MEKKLTIKNALICVLLALSIVMFASCADKKVNTDADDQQMTTEDVSATDDAADDTEEDMAAGMDTEEDNAAGIAELKEDFVNITIKFSYDSSSILDTEIPVLEAKAEWLRNNADATVTIQGHCDERGTTEYNLALGDRRAARVKSFLVNLGIDAERITTVSYGEEKPAVTGQTEEAWAANRRANCVID